MEITRVGDFSLGWGESLVWDERRGRLYFVDCAASTLHWLDSDDVVLETLTMPSMPTGVVPASDGTLVVALDDGLHVVDPDAQTCSLLAAYPAEIDGRCNDACADLNGNVITGKLNMAPAPGSAWQYSPTHGWNLLDHDISNTNGPTVGVLDGAMTLVIGDTAANYYSYPYDPNAGTVGARAVFGDVTALEGQPDGATLDSNGGLWCALVGGAQLVRFTTAGLDQILPLPVANPTDVTFGGPDLDRLFITSIGMSSPNDSTLDGALFVVDGLGAAGRPEPRFQHAAR